MKRIRKCCCGCDDKPLLFIAESPDETVEWDLSKLDFTGTSDIPSARKLKKYKNKCWRIEQTDLHSGFFRRICTIITGKISKTGKLLDLPNTVTLKGPIDEDYSTARLVVVCSRDCGKVGGCEKCGDPGVNGIVFKTNAGIEGDVWDISDLIGMQIPKDANGNLYQIQGRRFFSNSSSQNPSSQRIQEDYVTINYEVDVDGVITKITSTVSWITLENEIRTDGRYTELYYSCNYNCVPSPIINENESYALDAGTLYDLVERYKNVNGVAPPGSIWRIQYTSASCNNNQWYAPGPNQYDGIAHNGIVGAAGNLLGLPEGITPDVTPANTIRGYAIEIEKRDYCNQLGTSKPRLAFKQFTRIKEAATTYKGYRITGHSSISGTHMNYEYEFQYDRSEEYAEVVPLVVHEEAILSVMREMDYHRIVWRISFFLQSEEFCETNTSGAVSKVFAMIKGNAGPFSGTHTFERECMATEGSYHMNRCPANMNERCPLDSVRYAVNIGYIALVE